VAASILLVAIIIIGCNGQNQGGVDMPTNTATTAPANAGERWGGFIFVANGEDVQFQQTPGPAHHVEGEELIPADHPGTKVFGDTSEVLSADLVAPQLAVKPANPPAGYELIGVYIVESESNGVVDYALSYRHAETPRRSEREELFAPDLWIGWTNRAPQPLPVSLDPQDLEDGRYGHPYEKAEVNGHAAVYARWDNDGTVPHSLRINSALVWFDDSGRQWWVHGSEDFQVLHEVAESLGQ
jgi:hypothetical protein